MSNVTEEELLAEEESKRKYEDFANCFQRYVPQGINFVSESVIKRMNSYKIRAIQNLVGSGNVTIVIDDSCYKYAAASQQPIPAGYTESFYTTMLRLTTYIVLCRLEENVKGSLKTVQKHGLFFKLVPYDVSNYSHLGLCLKEDKAIQICVCSCLSSWCCQNSAIKKPWITHTVDHEFGHYLDEANEYLYNCSQRYFIMEKITVPKVPYAEKEWKNFIDEINEAIYKKSGEKDSCKKLVDYFQELIKKFSDRLVRIMSSRMGHLNMRPSLEALKMMYSKIKELNGGKAPKEGVSKYVETYEKYLTYPDDLSTANGEKWIKELYADSRAKSKARIYGEIKRAVGNNLKNDEDWKNFCKIADSYKGEHSEPPTKEEKAHNYREQLLKGRGIWGLAYRLLNLDKIDMEQRVVATYKEITEKIVPNALEKAKKKFETEIIDKYIKQTADVDQILEHQDDITNRFKKISDGAVCECNVLIERGINFMQRYFDNL